MSNTGQGEGHDELTPEWRGILTAIGSTFLEDMPAGCGFALFFYVKPTATEPGRIQYVSSDPRPLVLAMLCHFIERNSPDIVVEREEWGSNND